MAGKKESSFRSSASVGSHCEKTLSLKVETGHGAMIHDARVNFMGTKLATASADRMVRIFEVNTNSGSHQLTDELKGHQGPVWQLSWAHSKFGNILASCSYDRTVIIWKEVEQSRSQSTFGNGDAAGQLSPNWEMNYVYEDHGSSVNCVSWAPHEFGLILTCASSDGDISVLSWLEEDNRWNACRISNAHPLGCNSVSWCPFFTIDSNVNRSMKRFASAGNDSKVKIWREDEGVWTEEDVLLGHSDWVRDVAWAPDGGSTTMKIASGGQDRRVIIWTNPGGTASHLWTAETLHIFEDVVWNVSWSLSGDLLAVSGGENDVSLWKKNQNAGWKCINTV